MRVDGGLAKILFRPWLGRPTGLDVVVGDFSSVNPLEDIG